MLIYFLSKIVNIFPGPWSSFLFFFFLGICFKQFNGDSSIFFYVGRGGTERNWRTQCFKNLNSIHKTFIFIVVVWKKKKPCVINDSDSKEFGSCKRKRRQHKLSWKKVMTFHWCICLATGDLLISVPSSLFNCSFQHQLLVLFSTQIFCQKTVNKFYYLDLCLCLFLLLLYL